MRHAKVSAAADAWIAAGEPRVNHGDEPQLFVLGGASEERALLSFSLPRASASDVLLSAALVLSLSQAPNLGAGSAVFRVHPLTNVFTESRVTWLNYSNGASHTWATAGGDFGAEFGSAELRAGDAVLRVDITSLVLAVYVASGSELALLVRDERAAGVLPVNFAFTAREGVAAAVPQLDLEYCQ